MRFGKKISGSLAKAAYVHDHVSGNFEFNLSKIIRNNLDLLKNA